LYEDYLAGDKWKFVITLDEAWIYLDYCNGNTQICYYLRGQNPPQDWIKFCRDTFPNGFMIVGIITGRGVAPLIKVPSKTKINAIFYKEHVLKPLIEKILPTIYPNELDQVFVHHDKATSHTARVTQDYLKECNEKYGISFIANEDIPVKAPDASPLDFYGFGYLKQKLQLSKVSTVTGLWKKCKEIWSQISPSDIERVFDSWKRRCRMIVRVHGDHIEHTKSLHKKLL
jgi:hypothetical protein